MANSCDGYSEFVRSLLFTADNGCKSIHEFSEKLSFANFMKAL